MTLSSKISNAYLIRYFPAPESQTFLTNNLGLTIWAVKNLKAQGKTQLFSAVEKQTH